MVTDCDFVCNTEFGDLCTFTNSQCGGKECELYKNGVGIEDIAREQEEMQQLKSNMNR